MEKYPPNLMVKIVSCEISCKKLYEFSIFVKQNGVLMVQASQFNDSILKVKISQMLQE